LQKEEAKKIKEQLFPLDYKTFIESFQDRLLPEEIEELGTGEKQFDTVYFAGTIPNRTDESLQDLTKGLDEKRILFADKLGE
jgi:hypothetical protein